MPPKVKKRDGTLEDFVPDKVFRVVMATGLEETDAHKVSANISAWIKAQTTPEISSLQVRDAVVSELAKFSKPAHDLFVWYESTKEDKS